MSGREDPRSSEAAAALPSGRPTIEVLGTERMARAARLLFRDGYDTWEIAALFGRGEADIVDLLHSRALTRGPR